ncbi:hypothetical protein FHP25_07760 [Vineibacter terrae]|uniref:Uncharacterized protein n=1 Tax=Vineibacter terrae TaxID=2586908 RepID=A0A5C8PRT5_9HYPH|nr:methylamine utilization protein MauJ [Vineibacter terrae]TXL78092.1 hypothetical protein FHP25_07760 [Vineibacter terrae]
MLAKQLSQVLAQLCRHSEVVTDTTGDMDRRFESLRNYGRLPRGRGNRGHALSNEQIVAAVPGLTAVQPSWSGHVATILAKLKPVGGKTEAFGNAATLADALSSILIDCAIRHSVVSVRLSVAESGANSHGLAVITYEHDGTRGQLSFVRDEAVSLLQPGARLDAESRYAPANRELVLSQRFFDRLAGEIADARACPSPPVGDGSEYEREDAEEARRLRLGARPLSRFLNVGVDNQVTWPREEMLIEFDRYKLVLMPKTNDHMQSVHIDLHANRLSMEEAMTIINRFLSVLTWCDDQYAIMQDGWAGNPVPVAVHKRNLAFTTTYHWVFNRDIPASEEARRALALYREGRNAEQNFMIGYAVLSYFKVLEVRYPEGKDIRSWIAQIFPLLQSGLDADRAKAFLNACGNENVEQYLWKACRVAVAHVREKHPSDPDVVEELHRLHNAAAIMRRLARHFIRTELGVSDSPFSDAAEIASEQSAASPSPHGQTSH